MANHRAFQVACIAASLLAAGAAWSQAPTPEVIVHGQAPKPSKFEAVANRTGTLLKREDFVIDSARAQGIDAMVVRLDDITAHETVLSFQVVLPERRGVAIVSEEEMADLKDSVDYMVQNLTRLNESENPVRLEYTTLSHASFGYAVHRVIGDEMLAPTAYIEVPPNPFFPQIGGLQRTSPQFLQRVVADAQKKLDELKAQRDKEKAAEKAKS